MKNEITSVQQSVDTRPIPSPKAAEFTSSPLRNRILIQLDAPIFTVWQLIGDLSRFPEYSSGLARVDAQYDSHGRLTGYVCHFKPQEGETEGVISREHIRWYEPNGGYASSGEKGDAFGLKNDLHLLTLESSEKGAMLMCDEYYDAQDLPMMKTHFDEALGNMGENLIRRFGGKIVGRYVEC